MHAIVVDNSVDNEDRFIGSCFNRATGIEVREFRVKGVNLDSLKVMGRSEVSTGDGKGVNCAWTRNLGG